MYDMLNKNKLVHGWTEWLEMALIEIPKANC